MNNRQPIIGWGETMRLARRASALATEDMRRRNVISDPLDSSIMLYTDDPTTAVWFVANSDMAAICNTSRIEGVSIVMGEDFPSASFEADREDVELPRVAAMYFPAPGTKCPRCRNFTCLDLDDVCTRCQKQVPRPKK